MDYYVHRTFSFLAFTGTLDCMVAILGVYSAAHLTAEFLTTMRNRKLFESGLRELPPNHALVAPDIGELQTYLKSLTWRLLALLPIIGFLPLTEWAANDSFFYRWPSWCAYIGTVQLVSGNVRITFFLYCGLLSLAVMARSKTLHLVGTGASAVAGLYLLAIINIIYWDQLYTGRAVFRANVEGTYAALLFGVVLCMGAALKSIHQVIQIYRPEKIFLPGRDELEEFDGMGKWDEGSGRKG
jgi:hypothetical protein